MQRLGGLVVALGIAQIVSWGSLFYSIGVLGPSMSRDVGVSEVFLFGAFTAGLLVSGALSPLSGRLVDERGGGFVLALGSVLGAVALAVIATAAHAAVLLAGWLLAGAAMAACLYDTAFATLSQHADAAGFRRSVTILTIFGGFASTVFWPLSQVLMDAWGWRATLGAYAVVHLVVCLPIHLWSVPPVPAAHHAAVAAAKGSGAALARPGLALLNLSFVAASFVSAVVAVHMVSLLVAQGLTQAQAVTVAMLMGPMQVTGRIAEFGFASRIGVRTLGGITFGLFCVAVVVLVFAVQGFGPAAFLFVIAFGIGNGLFTIMRGTVPGELFGRERLGALLGYLARGSLYSRALAPACFSGILAIGVTRGAALAILAATALAGWGAFAAAVRAARRETPP